MMTTHLCSPGSEEGSVCLAQATTASSDDDDLVIEIECAHDGLPDSIELATLVDARLGR